MSRTPTGARTRRPTKNGWSAQRAPSPRAALMDRLSLLEGGIPGAAAYQAALRLLPKGPRSSGTKPPPGARWNRTEGAWEVDHGAAMGLWDPRDGVGLRLGRWWTRS